MISKNELHEIGHSRLKHYDTWLENNPEKLSLQRLKEAINWWDNQLKEDFLRLDQITDDVTYIAGFSNVTQCCILLGTVERYYIKKLESELAKAKKKNHLKL
ncbi:MAG: hypothetical protein COW26_02305 [Nitrosopumilales archaeon CG15_BIG_FIL_POST_REV_8_21_14_020_33_23]|nr:MAG: hypothetical protein COW26_02305 [Nitrosopumilales archaeon CG15_BIG_FIL_POST_REV_8_21_14_020_33_23]PIY90440.1 MAG: hypothetical protein COY74_01525 [Nitrosopumilales archaeon CG_4_10_14_0_8_um_filter_34_8]PJB98405.1 MAG: hypothetical protein CO079_02525 [Nitrosopumilales archaeon CG_4_9_14_0_8_um_filter_34_10]